MTWVAHHVQCFLFLSAYPGQPSSFRSSNGTHKFITIVTLVSDSYDLAHVLEVLAEELVYQFDLCSLAPDPQSSTLMSRPGVCSFLRERSLGYRV
jgi:hypothetical protein